MSFTDELRDLADPIWQAQLRHPFVRGIAGGTLELGRLAYWVRQDYRFLVEYCRLFALGAVRSPDLGTLTRFAELLVVTVRDEMALHRSYAERFGISGAELEAEPMAGSTQAYTDFLVRTAAVGDFAELVAALLPCMWGFSWLGQQLAQGPRPADERFAAWIDSYASEEFAQQARWCRELCDRVAEGAGQPVRERMRQAFLTSSRYELAFWDMAWQGAEGASQGPG
jgi:thiaminase/transcriptional activator TenA